MLKKLISVAISAALIAFPTTPEARGIHGGAPVSAPTPPSGFTPLTVYNNSGSTVTNVPVSFSDPMATGDVPTGSKFQYYDTDQTTLLATQQDQCSQWEQDSSKKNCAVSLVLASLSGSSKTIYRKIISGSPNTTPFISKAQIIANTDLKIISTDLLEASGTDEAGTWSLMDLNYVLTNCTEFDPTTGYGANPPCGWEYYAKGPNRVGIHAWMYARRGDGAWHRYLRNDVNVAFVPPASGSVPVYSFSYNPFQGNTFGGMASGTVGTSGAYQFSATGYNGANVIFSQGGASDSRVLTLLPSAFNTSTGVVTLPGGNWFDTTSGVFPVKFSSTGSLPTGITAGTVYWISGNGTGFIRLSLYQCATTGGSCTQAFIPNFVSAGTGTITMTPYLFTSPYDGFLGLDTKANRFWVSAAGTVTTAPPIQIGHDCTYLFQQSKAVPPYLVPLCGALRAFPYQQTYYPGMYTYDFDINTTGDNPGDDRIGYINHNSVYGLFMPADVNAAVTNRITAAAFSRYHIYHIDETTGLAVVLNNGPNRAGAQYAALGADQPTSRGYPFQTGSWMNPFIGGFDTDAFVERYQTWADGSHLPMPAQGAWLKTADPEWRFQMEQLANAVLLAPQNTQSTPSTVTYARAQLDNNQQTRGIGWVGRTLGRAWYYMPASSPLIPYFRDLMKDQAAYAVDYTANVATTQEKALGYWAIDLTTTDTHAYVQPWMGDHAFLGWGMEAWANEFPNYKTYLTTHVAKWSVGRMDPSVNGCVYYGPGRAVSPFLNFYGNSKTNIATTWPQLYGITAAQSNFDPNSPYYLQAPSSVAGRTPGTTTLTVDSVLTSNLAIGQYLASVQNLQIPPGTQILSGSSPSFTLNNATTLGGTFTGNSAGTTTLTASSVAGYIGDFSYLSGGGLPGGSNIQTQITGTAGAAGTYTTGSATTLTAAALTDSPQIYGAPTPSCPTTGIVKDGPPTSSNVQRPNSLATIAAITLAIGSLNGVTNSASLYANLRARQYDSAQTDGGPLDFVTTTFSGTTGSYPEFAIGPLGATN